MSTSIKLTVSHGLVWKMDSLDYEYFGEDVLGAGATDIFYDDDDYDANMMQNLKGNIFMCVIPTLTNGFSPVGKLLLWCLIFRATTQIATLPVAASHVISACTGLYMLYEFFSGTFLYMLGYAFVLYVILKLLPQFFYGHYVRVMLVISSVFLCICEWVLIDTKEWHRIRGSQMLLTMKVVSLAGDLDLGTIQSLPSPVQFAGYVFNVGTCIFGPPVSYKEYIRIYSSPEWDFRWVFKVIANLIIAMLFLTNSPCWCMWLIPDHAGRWLVAYRDALAFRSSHYFVSYVSAATAIACGFGRDESGELIVEVTKPLKIEIPRSLVQVVVYWNMPMHYWLKTYVFRTTIPHGTFLAVFSTYAVSSILHGPNLQLAAVLLSLGGYTYIEHILRQNLANVFSACILAKSCRRECKHKYQSSNYLVIITNIIFGLIAVFHLAYLGVMFDSSSTEQEHGYSLTHTLSKWSNLGYASHLVATFMYLFHLIVVSVN